jgi:hypothetical protein
MDRYIPHLNIRLSKTLIPEIAYCPSRPNHSIKTKNIINRIKFLGRISGIVKSELEKISEI